MVYNFVFEELADFLAGMNPEKVLSFRTSKKSQERLKELLEKNKSSSVLTTVEKREVEHFMILEHIVSLAKARALKKLATK